MQTKFAIVSDFGAHALQAALLALCPDAQFVTPAEAEITVATTYAKEHYETAEAVHQRIQALAAQLQTAAGPVVALVDAPETVAALSSAGINAVTVATEYGVDAKWHAAITTTTKAYTGFVLQGPGDAYMRGRVAGVRKHLVPFAALAAVAALTAGSDLDSVANVFAGAGLFASAGEVDLFELPVASLLPEDEHTHMWLGVQHLAPEELAAVFDSVGSVFDAPIYAVCSAHPDITKPNQRTARAATLYSGGMLAGLTQGVLLVRPATTVLSGQAAQFLQGLAQAYNAAPVTEFANVTAAIRHAHAHIPPQSVILVCGDLCAEVRRLVEENRLK